MKQDMNPELIERIRSFFEAENAGVMDFKRRKNGEYWWPLAKDSFAAWLQCWPIAQANIYKAGSEQIEESLDYISSSAFNHDGDPDSLIFHEQELRRALDLPQIDDTGEKIIDNYKAKS